MKKIRSITVILFLFCVVSIFSISYINLNMLSGYILKNVMGTNIQVKDIKLDGLILKITDIDIKDLKGEKIGNIKRANIYINPFLPMRIKNVSFNEGNLKIIQNKDGKINVNNIFPTSKSISRISNFSNIKLNNLNVVYVNNAFNKRIEKKLENVSGNMGILLENGFDINIKGESKGSLTGEKEYIDVKLSQKQDNELNILSLFSFKKRNDKNLKEIQEFNFKNVDIDETLSQFVPIKEVNAQSGKLNGWLKIEGKNKSQKLFSNLDFQSSKFRYEPYKGDIKNLKAKIIMQDKLVDVKANLKLDNNEIADLNLKYVLDTNNLNIKLKSENLSSYNLFKYDLLKKLNFKTDGKVSLNINLGMNLSNNKVNILTTNSTIVSNKINVQGVDLENFTISAVKNKKNPLKLKINSKILKGLIKAKAKLDLEYDLEKNNINGDYILFSLIDNIKIDDINGKISFNSFNDGKITVNSNQVNGNIHIKDKKISANLKTIHDILYKKEGISVNVSSIILDGIYDIETKNINAKIKANANGKIYDKFIKISALSNFDNEKAQSDLIINNPSGNLYVSGTTIFKSFEHNYKINGQIEALSLMKALKIDKKVNNKNTIPLSIKANVIGFNKYLSANYIIASKKINYFVTAYETIITGYAKNILSKKPDIKANIISNEIWYKYHRLKELNANIAYSDGNILINNIKNEFVNGEIIYNLKEKKINSKLDVSNYVVYSVYDIPDVNLYLDKLHLNLSGGIDDIKVNATLFPSVVRLKDKYIGYISGGAGLESNILSLDFKLNDSKIKGTYNVKTKYFDTLINLNQKIQEIFKVQELSSDVKVDMHITGKPNDLNIKIDSYLKDIYYKKMKLPDIKLDAYYEKGNISNLLKSGFIHVNSFDLINKKGENIYHSNFKLDLANLDIDYVLKNKIIDLSKIGENFKGKLEVNAKLKGNIDNFFGSIELSSDELYINNHKLTNIVIDGQMDQKGININQGYLEYEKNPILMEGYVFFKPLDYMFRIVAENFNLEFLNIYPNISDAKGIANINFIASKGSVEGQIKVDNMNLKSSNVELSNFNIDISMNNKDIDIKKFGGNLNGGLATLQGQMTIPNIPDSINELENIGFGKMNLNLLLDHVQFNVNDNNVVLSSLLNLKGEKLEGYVQLNSATIEDLSFINLFKNNSESKDESYIKKKIDMLIKGILKRYIVNVDFNMDKPIVVDVPGYLVLKDIYGEIQGGANITYVNGILSLKGTFTTDLGKFTLNNNEFTVETLDVTFDDNTTGVDPYINLKAFTVINGEVIEININSKLSEINIDFKSQTNKSKDEILSLLAFKGIKINNSSLKNVSSNVINYVTETAINQFISRFTNKIGKKIGLTKFEIGTNIENKEKLGISNFIDNASAQIHLQGKIIKDKNIYWNTKLSIPLNVSKGEVKYDVNVSYKLAEGLGANIGIKSDTSGYKVPNSVKNINFYTGVNYSNKFNDFSEFIESIESKFEKREKLEQNKKEEKNGKEIYEKKVKH